MTSIRPTSPLTSGHRIVVDGREITYLPAGVAVPHDTRELRGFDALDDRHLVRHPRVRRVLTTLVRPTPVLYNTLHWSDGTDLTHLDQKVAAGEATDEDFAGALLAEPQTVTCPTCKAQIRALVVDPGQVMFATTLPQRLRAHLLKRRCLVCDAPIGGLPLVEFLDEARAEP